MKARCATTVLMDSATAILSSHHASYVNEVHECYYSRASDSFSSDNRTIRVIQLPITSLQARLCKQRTSNDS